ncbi:unnamed protein product [Gadus morhua 'NCC']
MAHCTCMAGLGEVCSHAAALMFSLLAAVERREGQACTDNKCAWEDPGKKLVKYDELSNIFQKEKAKKHDDHHQMKPSADELKQFFEQLHSSENQEAIPKIAILSVVEGHSVRYIPKTVHLDLPPPLPTLYSSACLEMDLPSLLEEAARIFEELHLTPEQMGSAK